ncbi:hypothetical protein CI102_2487 [Trichoderma harzianum]|nr:hypothetical protein CI102_2487 [Trichoderma harzianum]
MALEAKSINVIGLLSGLLGVVSFYQENFANVPEKGTTIRIKAGLAQGDEKTDIEGNIGAVFAWDNNNNYRGKSKGKHIGEGSFEDIILSQFQHGRRLEYVAVAADEDAVCIAWIGVTMEDGTPNGAWTGDIGSECGQAWYHSNEVGGYFKDTQKRYIPRCTWLDADRSGDSVVAAMKFSVLAYGTDVAETVENKKQCDFTLWGSDAGPIAKRPGKRLVEQRKGWMENRLVVSKISQHKAVDLCNSTTSWGPDFVGSDGMFCDMHTKTLTPVCSFIDVDGCIDVDTDDKTITKRFTMAKREVALKHKSYSTVSQWS